jgi:hypothetical protein
VNTPVENLDMRYPPADRGVRAVVPPLLSLALMLIGSQAWAQQTSGPEDGVAAPADLAQFETMSTGLPGVPPPPPGPYSPIPDPGVMANPAPGLPNEYLPRSGGAIPPETGYGSGGVGHYGAAGTMRGSMGAAYGTAPGVVRSATPPAVGPTGYPPVPRYPGPSPRPVGPMPWPGYGGPAWPRPPFSGPMGPPYWRAPMGPAW